MPARDRPLSALGRIRAEAPLPRGGAAGPLAVAVLDG
jgi:hypothetical protein